MPTLAPIWRALSIHFRNALAGHLQRSRDLTRGFVSMVAPQDLGALDIAESGSSGLPKLIEASLLLIGKNEPGRRDACAVGPHNTKQGHMDMF